MKAIVYHRYGAPEFLRLEDVARPNPRDGEALVRIVAASVNPEDWYLLRGVPLLLRLGTGVRKPRKQILGLAFAGKIDTVPDGPTLLRPGDEVYGETTGGGGSPSISSCPKPPWRPSRSI
jgi:NADPH:quinone reductase-like Zn-dependent oxidoreductase